MSLTAEERHYLYWLMQGDDARSERNRLRQTIKWATTFLLLIPWTICINLKVSVSPSRRVRPEINQMMQNRTSVYNFSLLSDGAFRVNFDCYTARPHFIIVLDDASSTTYEDLSDDQKRQVISLALEMVNNYSLDESRAVLSQHCGTWYSSRHNYHAHLCVNANKYLAILKKRRNEFNNWRHNDQDIRDYPIDGMQKEVKEIEGLIIENVIEGADNVLFHPSEPRVGFVNKKSEKPTNPQAWLEVQDRLMSYANEKDLLEGEGDYNGCHVCLVLDGKTHGKSTLSLS